MLIKLALGLLCVLAVLMAWVRLSPNDPARFHVPVPPTPMQMDGGVIEVIKGDAQTLALLDEIARATPRTRLFAGSLEEGRVTYLTRTAFWGFPDFTTLDLQGDRIAIHARLRFGRKDFGVNAARVADWLARLEAARR